MTGQTEYILVEIIPCGDELLKKLFFIGVIMKKLLVCAAAVLCAAGLFAQEASHAFKFTTAIDSGIGLFATNQEDVDPYVSAWAPDAEVELYQLQFTGTYNGFDEFIGAKFRLRFNGGKTPFVKYAYGWINLLDHKITINGGYVDNSTWGSGGFYDSDLGEGVGTLIKVSPITDLDVGFGMYGNLKDDNQLKLSDAKYTFNLAYTMPELFKLVATFRPDNKAESSKMLISASILAVPDLTVVLTGELDNLNYFNDIGLINLYEAFGYALDDLSFGLDAAQLISRKTGDTALTLFLNPYINYTIGFGRISIVPRFDFVYVGAGRPYDISWETGGIPLYSNYNFDCVSPVYDKDFSFIFIKPSVAFNIGDSFIRLGDVISVENGPSDSWGTKDSRLSNAFYVEFYWTW
jgi:hypothetical protein